MFGDSNDDRKDSNNEPFYFMNTLTMKNLPSLTSFILSGSSNFENIGSIDLINIPRLSDFSVSGSNHFQYAYLIHSTNSDHITHFIQSKSSYARIVSSYIDIDSISVSIEELTFMDYSQLEMGLVTMDLSSFSQLKSFECGDNSFNSVRQFIINGLNELESISIGMNSFTLSENSYSERLNREFHLKNCLSLRELSIDRYSFSDY
ncbi:hypothetical protein WA171_001241, partial [Blastocystis sp. BT1]